MIIIAIILIIIIIVICGTDLSGVFSETFGSSKTCACVFDIDNTITCGFSRALNAVNECKKRNCVIALNTARILTDPTTDSKIDLKKIYEDLDLNKLGLKEEDFHDDVYYGTWLKNASYTTNESLMKDISETKTKHLETIQKKYNLSKDRIILFDDNLYNIEDAKKNGFSVIHANHVGCGLNDNVVSEIKRIL